MGTRIVRSFDRNASGTVVASTRGTGRSAIAPTITADATAATEKIGTEADIFKWVVGHSIALAAIVGGLVLLQAYVYPFTQMVPR